MMRPHQWYEVYDLQATSSTYRRGMFTCAKRDQVCNYLFPFFDFFS